MKNNKRKNTIVWGCVSAFIVSLFTAVTILENTMLEPIASTVLGGPKPIKGENFLDIYHSDYKTKEEATEAGNHLNEEISKEGFTLLLNENNALPIRTPKSDSSISTKPKISVFGKNSVNLVYGGSGSGGVGNVKASTLFEGLEAGGFEYNPILKKFYENDNESGKGRSNNPVTGDSSSSAPTLDIGETPIKNYSSNVQNSLKEYGDAAFVVISRLGGESWDLPRTQNVKAGGIEGNHYLQLDQNEYDLLDFVTSRFDKVIVLLNTLTSFQCDFINEYNNTSTGKRIDAVLWIGGPGTSGAKSVGDLLNGNVSPSGKTVDVYARDFTKDPTWQNFGDGSQVNGGKDNSAFLENGSPVANQNMVTYEEGVYVGYRYYETRAYEELIVDSSSTWYEENVIFPFGYGLSYTNFEQKITSVSGSLNEGESLEVTVETKNIGEVDGKDVIELYVSKPYSYGGIEKSYVELADFAKSPMLKPNETYSLTFTINPYDLASYDYNDANENEFIGYELESGDYSFYISSDSHIDSNSYDKTVVNLADSYTFQKDPTTNTVVQNLYTTDDYTDLQYRLSDVSISLENKNITRKGMSRTDFESTFPTALTKEEREVFNDEKNGRNELEEIKTFDHNNKRISDVTDLAKTGITLEGKEYTLRDLLDDEYKVNYNDDRWETLLDRISFEEMIELVNNGAFQTVAIPKIGKNLTNDSDGPIGFVNFMAGKSESYTGNTIFACEIVIGSTWNKDLAYQMGKIVGENGLYGDVNGNGLPYSGWYAPAVNLHRSPFAGRNFEYYSEDSILSGKLAVNVINGAATKGVYTNLKHFALNDQETNRAGVATFCTEQALRELYLKPFEIAVKGNDNPANVVTAKADGIENFKGTLGVMSSFNRIGTKWTGGDYRLLTNILRDEWGFKGFVISDYKTSNSFMNAKQMLYAGNDLILTSLSTYMWIDADSTNPQDVEILRQATKNILYVYANSNSIAVDIAGYRVEWWKVTTIALDCVAVIGIGAWGYFVLRKRKTIE